MPEVQLNENAEMINCENTNANAPIRTLTLIERFSPVAWDHPLFFGMSQVVPEVLSLSQWPDLEFFNLLAERRSLTLPDGRAISFVHQPKKPSRWRRRTARKLRYEESVLQHAVIPTRLGSWHDYFNNLSWLVFPKAKISLVQRLADTAENRTPYDLARGQFRSREGDRLAMLDEGGMIRAGGRDIVFGHALQESFVLQRLDVWGLTVTMALPQHEFDEPQLLLADIDARLAELIRSGYFAQEAPGFASTCLRDITSV